VAAVEVWVGTSGYSYTDWVGTFFPPGTRPGQLLAQYARHFPVVELNSTFYRPPSREVLLRQADKVPRSFQFLVKVPQVISHDQDPAELAGFRRAALALKQRHQLLGLLCQLPQSTHYADKTLQWLRRLAAALGDMRLSVEFRHVSWAHPEVPDWLAEHGLDLVAVDVPDLPALYPRGWVRSGSRAYVRLHSRNAAKWYKGDKQRYDFEYDDASLRE
jgi:uncharacterized protein YecE (DUF72 family)